MYQYVSEWGGRNGVWCTRSDVCSTPELTYGNRGRAAVVTAEDPKTDARP